MPLGYIQPMGNPYVGINVDYFDKKALEQQQRHDNARVAWGEMVQKGAEEEFRDEKARELYNQEQQKMFDEVISKNAGNLSAGYQDVIGAIEKSRLNPYHNLNKRHVEQGKLQQELAVKYGPRYIDKSVGINESLFSKDPRSGEVKWKSPMDIQANALLADEYDKNFENQVKELAATVIQKETELGHTASDRFTLANKIISNEQLSYKDIQDFISMPGIHEAFLGNNPTALEDTRKYAGTDKTYKDILTDPEAFKTWAFGQIADKKVEKSAEKYTYRTDQDDLLNARARQARQQALLQYKLDKLKRGDLSTINAVGQQKETTETYNTRLNRITTNKDLITNGKQELKGIKKNFKDITGIDVNDLNYYVDKDGKSVNMGFLKARLKDTYKDKSDTEIDAMANKFAPEIALLTRKFNETNMEINDLDRVVQDEENLMTNTSKNIYKQYYDQLSDFQKHNLRTIDIKTPEEFANYVQGHEKDVVKNFDGYQQRATYIPGFDFKKDPKKHTPEESEKMMASYNLTNIIGESLGYRDEQLKTGVNAGPMIYGKYSTDPNSMEQQLPALMKEVVTKQGLNSFMNGLSSMDGGNYMAQHPDVKSFLGQADGKNQTSTDITYDFIMPANSATNNSPVIRLYNKKTGEDMIITDAVSQDALRLFDEVGSRDIQDELLEFSNDPNYDVNKLNAAYESNGSRYGQLINQTFGQLKGLDPGNTRYVEFTTPNNERGRILATKIDGGYMLNNDPTSVYENIEDLNGKARQIIGAAVFYKNPNIGQIMQFIPNTGENLQNVDNSIKKSKIGETPDVNANAQEIVDDYEM